LEGVAPNQKPSRHTRVVGAWPMTKTQHDFSEEELERNLNRLQQTFTSSEKGCSQISLPNDLTELQALRVEISQAIQYYQMINSDFSAQQDWAQRGVQEFSEEREPIHFDSEHLLDPSPNYRWDQVHKYMTIDRTEFTLCLSILVDALKRYAHISRRLASNKDYDHLWHEHKLLMQGLTLSWSHLIHFLDFQLIIPLKDLEREVFAKIAEIQKHGVAKLCKHRGRPRSADIMTRNRILKTIAKKNPGATPKQILCLASNNQEIQRLDVKLTIYIIKNVLKSPRKRDKKPGN
jgi:hypothetical protein